MTRLSSAFLGLALSAMLGLPSVPAYAANTASTLHPSHSTTLAAKKKKKAKKKAKKKKKPVAAAPLEKGMQVVTLSDAVVLGTPSEKGDEVYRVAEGQVLTITKIGDDPAWVRVKDANDALGWLHAAEVVSKEVYDADAGGAAEGGEEEEASEDEGGEETAEDASEEKPGKPAKGDADDAEVAPDHEKKLRFAAGAQLGGLVRSQKFASDGDKPQSNYTIDISSPAVKAFARVTRKSGKLELGAEVAFMTTAGNSGITVGEGAAAVTLAWNMITVDGRVLVGYHVAPGYLVSARVGYRAQSITIDQNATIEQPSENLQGAVVGVDLDAYQLSPKLDLRLGVETMVAHTLAQTKGFEDGVEATKVRPIYAFVDVGYALTPKLQLVVGYLLSSEAYTFKGASTREPTNTNATRADLQHLFSVGAQYWF